MVLRALHPINRTKSKSVSHKATRLLTLLASVSHWKVQQQQQQQQQRQCYSVVLNVELG